ncbi:methylenetetrahydrofolate reductase [Athalassotoga saccharophila]|uniref:methylenetetrahydrofolate reductase n=1 Tax=Athalassotoga saccharophila TaxID=1441386 RepID=UPI00137AB5DE|nr:methylenetetrahydrofolate reductase [Athalassotoga saccharophila]BBJ27636.1 5,10-methylenetetrahydrofolate reductase [Athalassotoga saccharophila]
MKVIDLVKRQRILSIEVIPPDRGRDIDEIFSAIDEIMEFSPSFINVTRHAPEIDYIEFEDRIIKVPKIRRPGTVGVSAAIKNRYNVDVVPHVLCLGMNKFEIEDMLIDLKYLEIENVFVIRGELENKKEIDERDGYKHADELVDQISKMNKGIYLYPVENPKPTNFCIGVAGYPEKHYEALNMEEDLKYLKKKIDAGADYVITQMFFDFEIYKNFVERSREIGINVPIIPGIKPIVQFKSMVKIPSNFFVSIPKEFVFAMQEARTPQEEFKIGTRYMSKLVDKLLNYGVPGIHIFTMGRGKSTKALLEAIYK